MKPLSILTAIFILYSCNKTQELKTATTLAAPQVDSLTVTDTLVGNGTSLFQIRLAQFDGLIDSAFYKVVISQAGTGISRQDDLEIFGLQLFAYTSGTYSDRQVLRAPIDGFEFTWLQGTDFVDATFLEDSNNSSADSIFVSITYYKKLTQ